MPDREKVITALEFCTDTKPVETCFGKCPYAVADDDYRCRDMKLDALALLKEQETVNPIVTPWIENEDGEVIVAKRECGRCGYQFFTERPNFCENCGTPILWEGWER